MSCDRLRLVCFYCSTVFIIRIKLFRAILPETDGCVCATWGCGEIFVLQLGWFVKNFDGLVDVSGQMGDIGSGARRELVV